MKTIILILTIIASIFLQCSHRENHENASVTITCHVNDINILNKKIHLRIYNQGDKLICDTITDQAGKANVTLKTQETYYVDAYGFDEEGYYIDGSSRLHLSSDKPIQKYEIFMNYSSLF